MIFTAITVAVPASLLGVLLVNRKMVMIADAISHSVLPGIVVSFLVFNSREGGIMSLAAVLSGLLSSVLINYMKFKLHVREDAAIGSVFTFMFAAGVLGIAVFAGSNTDLDQDCLLYGDLETSILDQIIIKERVWGTRALLQQFVMTTGIIVVLVIARKAWKIWAFDPDFGKAIGMRILAWETLLLFMVSIYAVLSFESVGVVLVIGLLVLPPVTAMQLTRNYRLTFIYSACIGVLVSVVGVYVAKGLDISIAPTIVTMNGLLFATTVFATQLRTRLDG
jgi:manganese/zinc/iron transport system permease protein